MCTNKVSKRSLFSTNNVDFWLKFGNSGLVMCCHHNYSIVLGTWQIGNLMSCGCVELTRVSK